MPHSDNPPGLSLGTTRDGVKMAFWAGCSMVAFMAPVVVAAMAGVVISMAGYTSLNSGGIIGTAPNKFCQKRAEKMGLQWSFDPDMGCLVNHSGLWVEQKDLVVLSERDKPSRWVTREEFSAATRPPPTECAGRAAKIN